MTREEVRAELALILKEILSIGDVALTDATTAKDFDTWDSLAHIDIILAVEEKFSVRITATRASKLENVGELIDLICEQKK